jgi:hypothetical protein
MKTIDIKDYCLVSYKDDDITKQAVFDRLIEYFKKHEAFCGETICQCNNPSIDAPNVLGDIADFLFSVKYHDND